MQAREVYKDFMNTLRIDKQNVDIEEMADNDDLPYASKKQAKEAAGNE